MKKIILAILLLSASLMGCASEQRHTYLPEDRPALSDHSSQLRLKPDFDLQLLWSDAVLRVKVEDSGTEREAFSGSGIPIRATDFQVKILEVWQGEEDRDTVTLSIRGGLDSGVTKPLENDELVLFLKIEAETGIYYLIDEEYSMFAVNPDGTMYAFADMDEFTAYDGMEADDFRAEIQSKLENAPELAEEVSGTLNPERRMYQEYVLGE